MCTLTWKRTNDGRVLLFNRDEQRSRQTGLPPTLQQRNGTGFLAPTDPHHQGTWILVNEHGLILCILNHYPNIALPYFPNAPSRGLLPLLCADCRDADTAMDRLQAMPLMSYMPFRFVASGPARIVQALWNGKTLSVSTLPPTGGMLTSSSFCPDDVEQYRQTVFRNRVGRIEAASVETLDAFHRFPGIDRTYGIRMSRPDACTHSITRITVSKQSSRAVMRHEPLLPAGPECSHIEIALPLNPTSHCHDSRHSPVRTAH